jgi:acyl dehydratase
MAMDVTVGQELTPFAREAGFPAWNRYAAVNDEFIPIHMDDTAGKEAGYSGAFGMGNLQWAYLHVLLREFLAGSGGRIVKLHCQFRGASEQHHTVTAKGVVTAVREEGGERLVDLDVWTEIEDGTKLAPGTATVSIPAQ